DYAELETGTDFWIAGSRRILARDRPAPCRRSRHNGRPGDAGDRTSGKVSRHMGARAGIHGARESGGRDHFTPGTAHCRVSRAGRGMARDIGGTVSQTSMPNVRRASSLKRSGLQGGFHTTLTLAFLTPGNCSTLSFTS